MRAVLICVMCFLSPLSGCVQTPVELTDEERLFSGLDAFEPAEMNFTADEYQSLQVIDFDDEFLRVDVRIAPQATAEQVERFAGCVAARYAQQNNKSYLNQAYRKITPADSFLQASVVYLVSNDYPIGVDVSEVDITVEDCRLDEVRMS